MACPERVIDGRLRGACLDDPSEYEGPRTDEATPDLLDRLMELWQEPWSELAFGEAQMLVARLRTVIEATRRERDLAVAHDRQPYPTADAYERVCKARDDWQARAEAAQRALDEVRVKVKMLPTKLEYESSWDDEQAMYPCVPLDEVLAVLRDRGADRPTGDDYENAMDMLARGPDDVNSLAESIVWAAVETFLAARSALEASAVPEPWAEQHHQWHGGGDCGCSWAETLDRRTLPASAVPSEPVSRVELPDGACGVMRLCERPVGHDGPHQTSVDRAIEEVRPPASAVPETRDLLRESALRLANDVMDVAERDRWHDEDDQYGLREGAMEVQRLAATPPGQDSEDREEQIERIAAAMQKYVESITDPNNEYHSVYHDEHGTWCEPCPVERLSPAALYDAGLRAEGEPS